MDRLPNHAHYGDESFAKDSVGLGLGQRVNSIFKKLILRYFWGKMAPGVKKNLHHKQVLKCKQVLLNGRLLERRSRLPES